MAQAPSQPLRAATAPTARLTPADGSPTFLDHVRELQWRLFVVAVAFLAVGGAAYPFFGRIVDVLLAPLGGNHQLVYLTPGGAFGFIIQICMYVGIIGALPVAMYHTYRFVMPAVQVVTLRRVLAYTVASLLLAVVGVVFAYYVLLPAALQFLTSFNLHDINPMLTVDSYLSFVMAYVLAGALLFQLPLVMLIINRVKPLTPGRLMKAQPYIIVGSLVAAAVVSPTPDAVNQLLLALPVVVMYQVGIVIIWWRNRRTRLQPAPTLASVAFDEAALDRVAPAAAQMAGQVRPVGGVSRSTTTVGASLGRVGTADSQSPPPRPSGQVRALATRPVASASGLVDGGVQRSGLARVGNGAVGPAQVASSGRRAGVRPAVADTVPTTATPSRSASARSVAIPAVSVPASASPGSMPPPAAPSDGARPAQRRVIQVPDRRSVAAAPARGVVASSRSSDGLLTPAASDGF